MHRLSFPNGFEKTECVGKKLKNIATNYIYSAHQSTIYTYSHEKIQESN